MASTAGLRSILKKCGSSEVMDVVTGAVSSEYASLKPRTVYRAIQYDEVLHPISGTTIGGKGQRCRLKGRANVGCEPLLLLLLLAQARLSPSTIPTRTARLGMMSTQQSSEARQVWRRCSSSTAG